MKCKASATQEARPINEIGEPSSSAQRRNSPVQTVLQRSLSVYECDLNLGAWLIVALQAITH
ncbi:MAG: hypothetical protein ORN21_06930 [Methylophilaceae bacterium]|nr:hypothetical protein [Methylophilaceae bacterium]